MEELLQLTLADRVWMWDNLLINRLLKASHFSPSLPLFLLPFAPASLPLPLPPWLPPPPFPHSFLLTPSHSLSPSPSNFDSQVFDVVKRWANNWLGASREKLCLCVLRYDDDMCVFVCVCVRGGERERHCMYVYVSLSKSPCRVIIFTFSPHPPFFRCPPNPYHVPSWTHILS